MASALRGTWSIQAPSRRKAEWTVQRSHPCRTRDPHLAFEDDVELVGPHLALAKQGVPEPRAIPRSQWRPRARSPCGASPLNNSTLLSASDVLAMREYSWGQSRNPQANSLNVSAVPPPRFDSFSAALGPDARSVRDRSWLDPRQRPAHAIADGLPPLPRASSWVWRARRCSATYAHARKARLRAADEDLDIWPSRRGRERPRQCAGSGLESDEGRTLRRGLEPARSAWAITRAHSSAFGTAGGRPIGVAARVKADSSPAHRTAPPSSARLEPAARVPCVPLLLARCAYASIYAAAGTFLDGRHRSRSRGNFVCDVQTA